MPIQDLQSLTWKNLIWLGASGVTPTVSWIFIAMLLSFWVLGGALIVAGLPVIAHG